MMFFLNLTQFRSRSWFWNYKIDLFRVDTGDDGRISKEEFTAPPVKESIEKVICTYHILLYVLSENSLLIL